MTRDERYLMKAGFTLEEIHLDDLIYRYIEDRTRPPNFDNLPLHKQHEIIAKQAQLERAARNAMQYRAKEFMRLYGNNPPNYYELFEQYILRIPYKGKSKKKKGE